MLQDKMSSGRAAASTPEEKHSPAVWMEAFLTMMSMSLNGRGATGRAPSPGTWTPGRIVENDRLKLR